jgi:methyl-accepting chemotaxis protein
VGLPKQEEREDRKMKEERGLGDRLIDFQEHVILLGLAAGGIHKIFKDGSEPNDDEFGTLDSGFHDLGAELQSCIETYKKEVDKRRESIESIVHRANHTLEMIKEGAYIPKGIIEQSQKAMEELGSAHKRIMEAKEKAEDLEKSFEQVLSGYDAVKSKAKS